MGSLPSSRRTRLYLGESPFLPREASYIGFQFVSFLNHKSLGRSSGEPAGSKKQRRHRKPQRRLRRSGPTRAGRQESRDPLSAIAAPFIGTTRTFAFLKNARFSPFQKGRKRLQFPHRRAIFSRQRWVAMLEDFQPNLFVFHLTNPEDLFSIGRILVLPVDVLDHVCFQELELGRRVLGGREEERLSREARRLHPVLPRGPFLVCRSGFVGRLSCLFFSRARTALPSSLGT